MLIYYLLVSSEDAAQYAEDAEIVNQMNIALEIMANDDHFNADLADAAFMNNNREVKCFKYLHTSISVLNGPFLNN